MFRRIWVLYAVTGLVALLARGLVFSFLMESPLRYFSAIPSLDMHVSLDLGMRFYEGRAIFSLYNALVACVYKLNGCGHWPEAMVFIQMLLGAGGSVLIAYIAMRLSGKRTIALTAGLLAAVYAPELMYESITLRESCYVFFSLLSFAAVLKSRRLRGWRLVLCGAVMILPMYLRFAGVLWSVAALGWTCWRERSRGGWRVACHRAGLMLSGMLLVTFIAGVVNYFNSGNGWPLLINRGHLEVQMNIASRSVMDQLNPEVPAAVETEAVPGLGSRLAGRLSRALKFGLAIFKPFEVGNNVNYYFIRERFPVLRFFPGPGLVIPLALTGLLLICARLGFMRREGILFLYILSFALPIALFAPLGRYRIIMLPVFCYGVGYLAHFLFRLAWRRRPYVWSLWVLCLYGTLLYLTAPLSYPVRAADWVGWGRALEAKHSGFRAEALECYAIAFNTDPGNLPAAFSLGEALMIAGRYADASRVLAHADRLAGGVFGVRIMYVSSLLASGRPEIALELIKAMKPPEDNPREMLSYFYNAGEACRLTGDHAGALAFYRQGLALAVNDGQRNMLRQLIASQELRLRRK